MEDVGSAWVCLGVGRAGGGWVWLGEGIGWALADEVGEGEGLGFPLRLEVGRSLVAWLGVGVWLGLELLGFGSRPRIAPI